MILVDTSVWIDFLGNGRKAPGLPDRVLENEVVCHPWIIGEMMMGHLGPRRDRILADLETLPLLPVYSLGEISDFVRKEKLFWTGISFIDAHLIYAAILGDCLLWTHDRRLCATARRFHRTYPP